MKLGDFFVALGVKSDKKEVNEFNDALKGTIVKAAGLVAGLVGVSLGFREMVQDAISASMGMQAFEAETGLSGEQLNRWKNMAVMAGAGADAMSSSIKALQRNMTDIRYGGGNIAPFIRLGIDPRQQDPFAVMTQVMDRIKGMDRGTAASLVAQMGISPELMQMLTLSKAQLQAFSDTTLALSDKDKAKIVDLRNETTRAKLEFEAWSRITIANLAPALIAIVHGVEDLSNLMKGLAYHLQQMPVLLIAISAAAVAMAAAFFPVTTAVTALLLLLDDLYVYRHGGDSVIGELFGSGETKDQKAGMKGWHDKVVNSHGLLKSNMPALPANAVLGGAGGQATITQYINTTAPAREVADLSVDGIQTVLDRTLGLTNNGGAK